MTVTSTPAHVSQDWAVEATGIQKEFSGKRILNDLNLFIGSNEFVALLGRSGSGKSTLLRILGGLDTSYGGDVWVPECRSVMFQEPRLVPWKKVLPNVLLGLRPSGESNKAALRRQGLSALEEVGLEEKDGVWPGTLSGGEAQRVALARALVREPQLVLLDEPFGALDALTRVKMHVLLQALCERHRPAVLLVTHDVDEAILLADRVIVLVDGHISFDEQIDLARPRDRGDGGFNALRSRLLQQLGVTESPPNDSYRFKSNTAISQTTSIGVTK